MQKAFFLVLLAAAPLTSLSAADPVDNYAVRAMNNADYGAAIAKLEAHVKRAPSDETALLNLALAYRHVARAADADAAYRRVLKLDDVMLDAAGGGAISAHELARRGLAAAVVLSAR